MFRAHVGSTWTRTFPYLCKLHCLSPGKLLEYDQAILNSFIFEDCDLQTGFFSGAAGFASKGIEAHLACVNRFLTCRGKKMYR